jgi:hypothetical protein
LSGTDPSPDQQRHDEQPPAPPAQPRLVFKPDEKERERVARVRLLSFLAAGALMIVAFIMIISYRPPPVKLTLPEASRGLVPPTESAAATVSSMPSLAAPAARSAAGAEIVRAVTAAVDTLVSAAAEKWARASELGSQGIVTRDNAQVAADGFRKAAALADSARQDIRSAQQRAELVRDASRQTESRLSFRLSILYTAMDRYLRSLDDDAADRYSYYTKLQASAEALFQGDEAESEIQQNVAMSYLRHSEDRQAGLKLLLNQVREAQRNITNAGR